MPVPSPQPRHRLLVVSNATLTGAELFREIRGRADPPGTEVLIVAPALSSRLHYFMSDFDDGVANAQARLEGSLEHCAAAGGQLSDAHPLQAIDDAMRVFHPDEIIIATHPPGRSNWLERGVVRDARKRYRVPIVHVEVDAAHDDSHVIAPDPAARAA